MIKPYGLNKMKAALRKIISVPKGEVDRRTKKRQPSLVSRSVPQDRMCVKSIIALTSVDNSSTFAMRGQGWTLVSIP